MALKIYKTLPPLCEKCRKVVRYSDDYIRAHFTRGTMVLHYRCFLAAMKEHETAQEACKSA